MTLPPQGPAPVPENELRSKLSWKKVMLQAGIIAVLGAAVIFLVASILYNNERRELLRSTLSEATLNVEVQRDMMGNELRHMAHSMLFFGEQVASHRAVQTREGLQQLQSDFLSYMNTDSSMDQVRLLALNGRELARVNFDAGKPVIVPASRLQNKSDRYYFRQMQRMPEGALYISDMDLNVEHGDIELPFKPVIRMGMDIADEHGKRIGYLLINYLANTILDRFRNAAGLSQGSMLLLDTAGDVLSSPVPGQAWQHQIKPGTPSPLPAMVLHHLKASQQGRFSVGSEYYVYSSLQPGDAVLNIPAVSRVQPGAHAYWTIAVRLSREDIAALMAPYRDMLLRWSLTVLALLLAGAVPLAVQVQRRSIATAYSDMLIQAVEHAGEAVMITRPDGSIEYVNPAFCELTGYDREESLGHSPSELLKSNVQRPGFYKRMWNVISTGRVWSGHLIDRRKNGSLFPAELTIAPVANARGDIEHYISLMRDDSENQLLQEEQLNRKKMQAMSVAVGGIAHEFNNILAGLLGNAYLVRQLSGDNPEIVSRLETIEHLGHRASGIIRQMLAFVGHDDLELQLLDACTLCREVVQLFEAEVGARIRVSASIPDSPLMVQADSPALRRVLDELLSNALMAVADTQRPHIEFSLVPGLRKQRVGEEEDDYVDAPFVIFAVRDNGFGILPEHMDMLFEPFFTTRGVGEGTGMGLADAFGIVRQHHGLIEVESQPGRGAEFKVFLPQASD